MNHEYWREHLLMTSDNKLVPSGVSPYFRIWERPINYLKGNDYQILDFGTFNKEEFSTSLVPFKVGSIHRINLSGYASFRIHIIENWVNHKIARTLKPSRLVMALHTKAPFGIFQGIQTRRIYATLLNTMDSYLLFSPLPTGYSMKELINLFDLLLGTMSVVSVHES